MLLVKQLGALVVDEYSENSEQNPAKTRISNQNKRKERVSNDEEGPAALRIRWEIQFYASFWILLYLIYIPLA